MRPVIAFELHSMPLVEARLGRKKTADDHLSCGAVLLDFPLHSIQNLGDHLRTRRIEGARPAQ